MEKHSDNFRTLCSSHTDLNADSVEWCPHEPNQNVFVCANYQLVEQSEDVVSKRIGKILLFTYSKEENLKVYQTLETPGILDQKWCPNKLNECSILGVATATGQVSIYTLNSEKILLKLLCTYAVRTTDVLILSLDWSSGKYSSNEPDIVCSDSKGCLHLLRFCENNLELVASWEGHNSQWGLTFEAWIAGFYYWDTNTFFSGGDDGVFLMYDRRTEGKPVGKNKSHQAGVTTIHSNADKEYVVATGSYDQHIRLWDIRNIKEETNTTKMPGEVWRLKWDPFTKSLLLAACMYNGVHIVDYTSLNDGKIVGSYYEHKNISYGVDWAYNNLKKSLNAPDEYLIGSCSFYDKLLCISSFCHNKGDKT